jgi:hypothetical protein
MLQKLTPHMCKVSMRSIGNEKYDIWSCYELNGTLQVWVSDGIEPHSHGVAVDYCPFCGFQPDRSKREDLEKIECKECDKVIEDILRSACCSDCLYHYLDFSEMRCSEH